MCLKCEKETAKRCFKLIPLNEEFVEDGVAYVTIVRRDLEDALALISRGYSEHSNEVFERGFRFGAESISNLISDALFPALVGNKEDDDILIGTRVPMTEVTLRIVQETVGDKESREPLLDRLRRKFSEEHVHSDEGHEVTQYLADYVMISQMDDT